MANREPRVDGNAERRERVREDLIERVGRSFWRLALNEIAERDRLCLFECACIAELVDEAIDSIRQLCDIFEQHDCVVCLQGPGRPGEAREHA